MSLTLPPELAQHLDTQAKRFAIGKANYVRMLLAQDLERQTAARVG